MNFLRVSPMSTRMSSHHLDPYGFFSNSSVLKALTYFLIGSISVVLKYFDQLLTSIFHHHCHQPTNHRCSSPHLIIIPSDKFLSYHYGCYLIIPTRGVSIVGFITSISLKKERSSYLPTLIYLCSHLPSSEQDHS